jgi:hypothetical protein
MVLEQEARAELLTRIVELHFINVIIICVQEIIDCPFK